MSLSNAGSSCPSLTVKFANLVEGPFSIVTYNLYVVVVTLSSAVTTISISLSPSLSFVEPGETIVESASVLIPITL